LSILDLRQKSILEDNISKKLNDLANQEGKAFTNIIGEISAPYKNNIDWWVSSPASRNTLNSDLFLSYCKVKLIKGLLENGNYIDKIIVDTSEMKSVISQLEGINDTIIETDKSIFIRTLQNFVIFSLSIAKQTIYRLSQTILYQLLYRGKNILPTEPIILIDTFALPGYYSKDRYYNGLWDSLNNKEKKNIYFVPTIVGTKLNKYFSAYKEFFNSERQFIFKEAYIKISDIAYALLYFIRIRTIKVKPIVINNIDFSPLINAELRQRGGYNLAIEGLINYRFIKRLKQQNVRLFKVIDWWENQALDKGLHMALNQYYPNTSVTGYLGYAPRKLELQLYPADYEYYYNVVPEKIMVIGKGFVDGLKIFNPDHNINHAPAFRFQHLWNDMPHDLDNNQYTILIALPIIFNDSIHILKQVNKCLNDLSFNKFRIWVKPHPANPINKIKNELGIEWPNVFNIFEGDSQVTLRKADILISGMSSICMEAMALGVPVIIVNQPNSFQFVPVPDEMSNELWKTCSNKVEIIQTLEHFRYRNKKELIRHKNLGKEIRKIYFEPVTRKMTLRFLN
jgi:hypothetical protein